MLISSHHYVTEAYIPELLLSQSCQLSSWPTLPWLSVLLMSRSLQDAVTSGNVGEVEVRLNMGEDVNDSFPPRLVNTETVDRADSSSTVTSPVCTPPS